MAKLVAPFVWALVAATALGSLSIWLFWVRPYIRVNGGTPSPAIFRYSSFRDSREARRIAREKGQAALVSNLASNTDSCRNSAGLILVSRHKGETVRLSFHPAY